MIRETDKFLRHWKLGLTIDGLLALLIGAPIWVTVHTSTVEAWTAALAWWPWVAAALVGLVIWYAICDDRELVALVVEAPRMIVYAVMLLVTAPWWMRQVREYQEGEQECETTFG